MLEVAAAKLRNGLHVGSVETFKEQLKAYLYISDFN